VRGVYAKSGHSRKIRLVAKVIKLVGAPRVVRSAGQYCDEFKPYEFLYHRSNHDDGKKPRRKWERGGGRGVLVSRRST